MERGSRRNRPLEHAYGFNPKKDKRPPRPQPRSRRPHRPQRTRHRPRHPQKLPQPPIPHHHRLHPTRPLMSAERQPVVPQKSEKWYYVDEAGDPVLFNSKGQVLIGTPGCTRFFILGVLDVANPEKLADGLNDLRKKLLSDPFFKDVPSFQGAEGKTALFFHAKDDLPEVRRDVFKLLLEHDIRFSAIVRDKFSVLEYVRGRNQDIYKPYRYHPNELYDFMVRRLFKERLHKHDKYTIAFARRGTSDRTAALKQALDSARQRFQFTTGIVGKAEIIVVPSSPAKEASLQAADYFLWALQRTFERGEDRFLQFLWPNVSLVIDADDTRTAQYGTYYRQKKKPLTAAALKEAEGYRSKPPK